MESVVRLAPLNYQREAHHKLGQSQTSRNTKTADQGMVLMQLEQISDLYLMKSQELRGGDDVQNAEKMSKYQYFKPPPNVDHPVLEVPTPVPAASTSSPSSTTVDQDAPSKSTFTYHFLNKKSLVIPYSSATTMVVTEGQFGLLESVASEEFFSLWPFDALVAYFLRGPLEVASLLVLQRGFLLTLLFLRPDLALGDEQ
ncbi:hypothetical protein Tco_0455081 [Tanacetum coccineum]